VVFDYKGSPPFDDISKDLLDAIVVARLSEQISHPRTSTPPPPPPPPPRNNESSVGTSYLFSVIEALILPRWSGRVPVPASRTAKRLFLPSPRASGAPSSGRTLSPEREDLFQLKRSNSPSPGPLLCELRFLFAFPVRVPPIQVVHLSPFLHSEAQSSASLADRSPPRRPTLFLRATTSLPTSIAFPPPGSLISSSSPWPQPCALCRLSKSRDFSTLTIAPL